MKFCECRTAAVVAYSTEKCLADWNKPEATARVIDGNGYFRTGDIVVVDELGFIHIVDRVRDRVLTIQFGMLADVVLSVRCLCYWWLWHCAASASHVYRESDIHPQAKDIIIRGGENISCAEVEVAFASSSNESDCASPQAAIYHHPSVMEVAVFGVPDQRLGEEVAAMVHLKPGPATSRLLHTPLCVSLGSSSQSLE